MNEDRHAGALLNAIAQKSGLTTMGQIPDTTFRRTGTALDDVFGDGKGVPEGHIIELTGRAGGLTFDVAMTVAANLLRGGGNVVLYAPNGKLAKLRAKELGVPDELIILKLKYSDDAWKAMADLLEIGRRVEDPVDLAILHVASLASRGKATVAELLSDGLRSANVELGRTTVLILNTTATIRRASGKALRAQGIGGDRRLMYLFGSALVGDARFEARGEDKPDVRLVTVTLQGCVEPRKTPTAEVEVPALYGFTDFQPVLTPVNDDALAESDAAATAAPDGQEPDSQPTVGKPAGGPGQNGQSRNGHRRKTGGLANGTPVRGGGGELTTTPS